MRRLGALLKHVSPATVVAIVALVFAMSGGAFALSGGGSGGGHATAQVAKAKKKSKSKSTTGPRGPKGETGPAGKEGKEGKEGPAGKEGKEGKAGANGSNGESVKLAAAGACKEGGTKLTVGGESKEVCNGAKGAEGEPGEEGSPWTTGSTLPKGSEKVGKKGEPGPQETGVWAYVPADAETREDVPISFPIKLATALPAENPVSHENSVEYIRPGEQEGETFESFAIEQGHCGGTAAHPEAAAGYLCVFVSYEAGKKVSWEGIFSPLTAGRTGAERGVTATTGAVIVFKTEALEKQEWVGTWAVGGD